MGIREFGNIDKKMKEAEKAIKKKAQHPDVNNLERCGSISMELDALYMDIVKYSLHQLLVWICA